MDGEADATTSVRKEAGYMCWKIEAGSSKAWLKNFSAESMRCACV